MANGYPEYMRQVEELESIGAIHETGGTGVRALDRLHQVFCALRGHDNLLQLGRARMFLKCASCGQESPGWALCETRPAVREHAVKVRRPVVVPQLISVRRVA